MNIVTSLKDYGWVAAGSIGGIIAGAAVNISRNSGSLFAHDSSACRRPFNDFSPFVFINNFREDDLKNTSIPSPLIACFAPMIGFTILNTITSRDPNERGIKNFVKRGWHQVSNNVIYPITYNSVQLVTSVYIRFRVQSTAQNWEIDISGHSLLQGTYTLCMLDSMAAIAKTGTPNQKKLYATICGIVALTDLIWMYNTTANCHSVLDVALGVAIIGLSRLGITTGKALISKGFEAAKTLASKGFSLLWPKKLF